MGFDDADSKRTNELLHKITRTKVIRYTLYTVYTYRFSIGKWFSFDSISVVVVCIFWAHETPSNRWLRQLCALWNGPIEIERKYK